MLEQLAIARGVVQAGRNVVPAWRIQTPEGPFLVLTKFDQAKIEQGARALHLLKRFMTWKMATSYVTTAEIWLGPELTRKGPEALSVVGVSRNDRRAAIQRIQRNPLSFGEIEWLTTRAGGLYAFLLAARDGKLAHARRHYGARDLLRPGRRVCSYAAVLIKADVKRGMRVTRTRSTF